jgi:hypothetical protein
MNRPSLLSRTFLPFLALAALLLASVPAEAASTLSKTLQGTYTIKSSILVLNGKSKSSGGTGSFKVGAPGLAGKGVISGILGKNGLSLKYTGVKSSPTSFSAFASGTASSGKTTLHGTVKATLNSSSFTIKFTFAGVKSGTPVSGRLTIVLKKKA